jgi:hypothetical protein
MFNTGLSHPTLIIFSPLAEWLVIFKIFNPLELSPLADYTNNGLSAHLGDYILYTLYNLKFAAPPSEQMSNART